MISHSARLPKKPALDQHSSSSDDEPNVEITEVDDMHSSTTSYVLNPKIKAFALSLPPVEYVGNDTIIRDGPYETDLAVSVVQAGTTRNPRIQPAEVVCSSPKTRQQPAHKWHERTAKKGFTSENNPHDLVRCAQKEKYVWYAAYDDEMFSERFMETLAACTDKGAPIVLHVCSPLIGGQRRADRGLRGHLHAGCRS